MPYCIVMCVVEIKAAKRAIEQRDGAAEEHSHRVRA
jgi:hypothetical protein